MVGLTDCLILAKFSSDSDIRLNIQCQICNNCAYLNVNSDLSSNFLFVFVLETAGDFKFILFFSIFY